MKIIAGNWKMNGSLHNLEQMITDLSDLSTQNTVILAVPYTMLCVKSDKIGLASQDISTHERGAYTGEVSASMVAATGAKYTIIGHSECRQYHGDTNASVRAKAEQALSNGLTPIICIGETISEKQSGKTMEIIESGLRESVPMNVTSKIIIAYEPRWAIGAGITPTSEEITEAHEFIAQILSDMGLDGTPILYGASVKGSNAAEIMSIPHVDGVLVGGASLKTEDFIPIITSVK